MKCNGLPLFYKKKKQKKNTNPNNNAFCRLLPHDLNLAVATASTAKLHDLGREEQCDNHNSEV